MRRKRDIHIQSERSLRLCISEECVKILNNNKLKNIKWRLKRERMEARVSRGSAM
jgi:hypothetical protein